MWRGRDGDGKSEETTYTRVFRIWTDDGADDATVVGARMALTPYFVYPGAVHPNDSRAFCVGARPQNDLGNRGWLMAVTYSTKRELAQQPQNDPIKISWDEEDYERQVVKDRNGKAVVNSAGDPPDPPVTAADSILIAKINLKVAAVPAYLRAYRKSINSAAFTIDGLTVSAKRGRVRRISMGEQLYRGSYPFREVNIELAILDETEDDWEIRWLDAGFRKKVSDGAGGFKREKIVSSDGTEPTQPAPLDGSGSPLVDPTLDNAVFNVTPWYRLKVFAANIPGCT